MIETKQAVARGISCALRIWLAVTGLAAASSLLLYVSCGVKGLALLIQVGPLSIAEQTLSCVAITWLAWGIALLLLNNPAIRDQQGVAIICSVLLLLLYVNFLRERIHYADVDDYVRAAFNLHDGQPFHSRYLYPPLLATLCQPFLPLGAHGVSAVFWLANLVSLVAFFWLLSALLGCYGFGRRLALALAFLFMVVNVPILRTLGYVQINLHVVNLILLALLLFPKHRIVSALALALAVHLKASPLVLALPFFLTRDRTWGVSFLAWLIGLAGVTFCFYGGAPFMAFSDNIRNVYGANGICFRENSVDSLIRSAGYVVGMEASAMVLFFKVPVILGLLCGVGYTMRKATFSFGSEGRSAILNSIPILCVLMVFASPLVWEHHLVFLAVPFLVVIKKLNTPAAWMWYSFAYLLAFLVPTFDFYPWSFGHLVSAVIVTLLMLRFCRESDAAWVATAGSRMDALFCGETEGR